VEQARPGASGASDPTRPNGRDGHTWTVLDGHDLNPVTARVRVGTWPKWRARLQEAVAGDR